MDNQESEKRIVQVVPELNDVSGAWVERYISAAGYELGPSCEDPWVEYLRRYLRAMPDILALIVSGGDDRELQKMLWDMVNKTLLG